ncbi:(E2-independent) E3 ubiquitin-conjugating enzyme FATS isoform X2 [Colius striatus]|uniref:(E2-independent) E3 ubiquitin-conjugating enzyme FATS isoform X2 n=1 Tax=Colius striatus TaxID=57412 RepID=UPI002B1DB388|nr:(E2-independent) E3 ubiquitin-conjugating enzyme FATS isoform X2 [Colius striatus]
MLMQGGGRHELFMPWQPEQADPGFSCHHCNKWWLCPGHRPALQSPAMPAAEGKPPCLRCTQHTRLDFQVKPCAKWTRETQSFVTQMYLTINFSSWKKKGCFGVTQRQWGTDGQRTCTDLRWESAAEGRSNSTKKPLSSQNTSVSPRVVSQMIDEDKSKGSWPALPMQSMITQPNAYPTKQAGSVNINQAFTVLPSRLETQATLDDTTSPSNCPITEEKQCPKQQKGFASITVTARRVAAASSDAASGPGAVQDPSAVSPTSCKVLRRWPLPGTTNQRVSPLQFSNTCSQLDEELQKGLFDPGNKERGVGLPKGDGRAKVPPSFISCVHLPVSQQCPSTIYYLDRSLVVCIDQPRIKCQKIHRSALSFTINCSSSRLTADGVDGIANGEPIEEMLQTKLPGESKTPLRYNSSPDLAKNNVINKQKPKGSYLGSKYPLQTVLVSKLPAFVSIPRGLHDTVTAKEDDDKQSGSYHTTLALQPHNPSGEAGDDEFCGSSDKIKDHEEEEEREGASRVTPSTARSPEAAPEENHTLTQPDTGSQPQKIPPAPQTLQEALEIYNPQFISRSQERLKRLERMVQLRKARQGDAPTGNQGALLVRKLSSTSTSSRRKQYTIPHPLSDNLFKPKERVIPEKEMHMRSKRIYDNLPEVKKKQKEKQKRIIIQSNRLRVEIFKKQLLDRLLQRNTE